MMDDFENMSEFSPFTWQPVYADGSGEVIDFNSAIESQSQFSTSRGMLETIVEETSDDEDNGPYSGQWTGSDSFSSGSSETGSVVRVDAAGDHDNQDAMSERDFICPPKRRKQEIELTTAASTVSAISSANKLDFIPTSSLFSQLLNPSMNSENGIFENYFMKQNDLRYRFDELGVELFSDSDRLSYTSLSRSSSLIQFESLERQLQSDSQISSSSPSLLSYEGANTIALTTTNNSSCGVVVQAEINEKSHAPILINLPTITISNPLPVAVPTTKFNNSDTEPFSTGSSTSGSYSSDDSEIHVQTLPSSEILPVDSSLSSSSSADEKLSSNTGFISITTTNTPPMSAKSNGSRQKYLNSFRAKNSVDSLSEDSGYCDRDIRSLPAGALSSLDSSSLPTGNDLEDEDGNLIEEKSLMKMKTVDEVDKTTIREFLSRTRRSRSDDDEEYDDDVCYHSMENVNSSQRRRMKARKLDFDEDSLSSHEFSPRKRANREKMLKIESPNVQHRVSVPHEQKTMVKNKNEESSSEIQSEKLISISLPELSKRSDISRRSRNKKNPRTTVSEEFRYQISSLPDNLNANESETSEFNSDQFDSIANKNFNLYDINYGVKSQCKSSQKIVDISASCANLTLLNYSDEDEYSPISPLINRSKSHCFGMSSSSGMGNSGGGGKVPANVYSSDDDDDAFIASYRSKELSSLLEEISAHFDKNLSILNDHEECYEPPQVEVKAIQMSRDPPPKPPPRRSQIKTSPNYSATPKCLSTFDRDPTNLKTTYAESLEKCNFDVDAPIKVYDSRQNLYLLQDDEKTSDLPTTSSSSSLPSNKKRNFVSSTPNLNFFDFSMKHVNHYSSTDNTAAMSNDLDFHSNRNDDQRCISMKEIPTNSRASSTGILASHSTAGSKSGLSVSFCPIVSEISWHENPEYEEDENDEEFLDDIEMERLNAARNDSLVNYYGNNDDDDDEEDFDDFIAVGTSSSTVAPADDHHEQSTNTLKVTDEMIVEKQATLTPTKHETLSSEVVETLNNSTVSSKMLVETQTPSSEKFIAAEAAAIALTERKVNNQQMMTTVPQRISSTDIEMSKNSKNNKKSFLSRISSGFRFSFRGKKSKKSVDDGVFHYPTEANNNSNGHSVIAASATGANKKRADKPAPPPRVNSVKSTTTTRNSDNDFIFIPLRGDTNDNNNEGQLANGLESSLPPPSDKRATLPQVGGDRQSRIQQSPPRGVMGKPPLPKQPPRIVGVVKRPPTGASTHARASSTPREVESGEFYNQSMIGNGLKQYYTSGGPQTMMGSEHRIGLIETNLDTDETVINGKTQSLMELGISQNSGLLGRKVLQNVNGVSGSCSANSEGAAGRHHKSMEFLLDKENRQIILPPENELQKARENDLTLSEHQLRVQASLQKLNIPDWYKQYSSTSGHNTSMNTSVYNRNDSGLLRKRNSESGGRWQGLSSKTTSLSSLGSNRSDRSPVMLSPSAHSHTGAGQTTGFSRWSTSHLNSNQTSPSVSARSSFVRNTNYTSSIISGSSVASSIQPTDVRNSFRKPYLGWRSQEKLSQPKTPHERLAQSLLQQKEQQQKLQHPVATPEIQSSIKEVTSAIVHYVNDQTNRGGSRSRSVSPSARCWLESSFVGTKPVDSPQTPALDKPNYVPAHQQRVNIGPMSMTATNYDSYRMNGGAESTSSAFVSSFYPSDSATSLEEEVILSLLGLPSDQMHKSSSEDLVNSSYRGGVSTFKPTPVIQPQQQQSSLAVDQSQGHSRRHSEGDAQRKYNNEQNRCLKEQQDEDKSSEIEISNVSIRHQRGSVSTSTSPAPTHRRNSILLEATSETTANGLFRCRFPKCENAATALDAKKNYKSCHNCSHLYCSRDCRRLHWEKGHRRACLQSRVSVLCRQVLSSCKDDPDTLKHLSLLARRGFLAQGRGVVRLLFRSPENAEIFIKHGFQSLGEVSYVRWPDLMPSEMGAELYSELLRLSIEYKPDGKMLIYVAICVVSEAPGASTSAPVKWERQLVSRCAKLKLDRSIVNDKSLFVTNSSAPMSLNTNASSYIMGGTHIVKQEFNTDVLILTFNSADKNTQKSREIIMANVQQTLQDKGINLRKHFPEVYQRLNNYVEGLSSFMPVTIHPRDNITGRPFVCIIFPQSDADKIKMLPRQGETGHDRVQTIDVGIERTQDLTHNSLNHELFTEGTKF